MLVKGYGLAALRRVSSEDLTYSITLHVEFTATQTTDETTLTDADTILVVAVKGRNGGGRNG